MTRLSRHCRGGAMPDGMVSAHAVELDPKIVGFTLPDDIKWTENARAGNRSGGAARAIRPSRGPTRCCSPGCPAT